MSDSANDLFKRKRDQAARELDEAEREAAASGKEPFDMARLDELLGEEGGTGEPEEVLLREKYYILYPEILTLAEFAALRKMLSLWEEL